MIPMKIAPEVKLNAYSIIVDAVEKGVMFGLNRAYKHTDTPSRETIAENVEREIMNILCEIFVFEDN
jgi:hypothetical protein